MIPIFCKFGGAIRRMITGGAMLGLAMTGLGQDPGPLAIGLSAVDITPDYPVRLSGFGVRRAESEGVTQRIWAKAFAFQDAVKGPLILITTDNLCVPDQITQEIARRLEKSGLKRERLTITATHTHSAPMLKNTCPTIFGVPIPAAHQENIDRYTRDFTDKLEKVALAALKDVAPARLFRGQGKVSFAINRRTKGGPVDHDLPFLVVQDLNGRIRGIYFSYACHCVTLSDNKVNGDWAGYAQEILQEQFPGAVALASVGCGADSNPDSGVTRTNIAACREQGQQIANEVKRVMGIGLKPVTQAPDTRYTRLDLEFDTPRPRAEWETRAKRDDWAGHHARVNLARLDRGEALPVSINYPIQTWLFGNELAIVFLPGETVVDYSLRLKSEFDRSRLWVNGYSNEGRCYVPSERILKEGGYEGGEAMMVYDMPQRFATGIEQKIIDAVHKQVPETFKVQPGTEGIRPLSPEEAQGAFHLRSDLTIELVACEPLVVDPIAIDWSADGLLWVCEMRDYPSGVDGDWKPGGRIKVLRDQNGDGRYDEATIFLDNIPFPTGIMNWNGGVLVCSAPDILWARDTNGDFKADRVEKLFTGFATDNYQGRVNGLSLGLDNWIYGANGLLGGVIRTIPNSLFPDAMASSLDIRNRDFRFSPRTGVFELASGHTQHGRSHDDWDNWFGSDSGRLLLHYPTPERYLRRNAGLSGVEPVRHLTAGPDGTLLFPTSRLLERFNDFDTANRSTSACGVGIYRDNLMGEEYYGNAFTCEPVHNLVHREVLREDIRLDSQRGENQREFLSSSDNWFRPVQARTGPDGALYIVDMYRFLVEHPRWIPAERLANIDVRAGADKGRIYRVYSKEKPLRPIRDLTRLNAEVLASALDTPNGTERDRVQAELLARREPAAGPRLKTLAREARLPQVRVQALYALDGVTGVDPEVVKGALSDTDARVRIHGLRLAERFLAKGDPRGLLDSVMALTNETAFPVLRQLAFSLGESKTPEAGKALAALATKWLSTAEMRLAVLTSAAAHSEPLLDRILAINEGTEGREEWISQLIATAAASGNQAALRSVLVHALPAKGTSPSWKQLRIIADLVDAVRNGQALPALPFEAGSNEAELYEQTLAFAREKANAEDSPELAENALRLLGSNAAEADLHLLCRATESSRENLRRTALTGLRRQRRAVTADYLIERWAQSSPIVRLEKARLLLEREEWTRALLEAVRAGRVQAQEIPLEDRQRLLRSEIPEIRELAVKSVSLPEVKSRADLAEQYKAALDLSGDAASGREVFALACASCHALDGIGHRVGPDLAALRGKDANYWLKNILDPNAVIEPRFINYDLDLKDGRTLSGLIKSETTASVLIVAGNEITETVRREEIEAIRASSVSLMPEGLEQTITVPRMADLLAFVRAAQAKSPERPAGDQVLRDARLVARFILDSTRPPAAREAAVAANPHAAGTLIQEMTRDLTAGTPEEYVRIPWIWRVAIACGKRNDPGQIRAVLQVSLPPGEKLHDWQAVVIGGGVINGISVRDWPRERIGAILASDSSLLSRWEKAMEMASKMADDERVAIGTRYDALRMLGVETWEKRGAQLVRYLAHDVHPELQMGSVSALADMRSHPASRALLAAIPDLTERNGNTALQTFLKDDEGTALLLDAIENGRLSSILLGASLKQQLLESTNAAFAARARQALSR